MVQRENLPVGFSQRSLFSAQKIGKGKGKVVPNKNSPRVGPAICWCTVYSTSKKADRFSAKVAAAVDFLRHKY